MVQAIQSAPTLRELVTRSALLAELDGLPEQAAAWQSELPEVRRGLALEARDLAAPRVWTDTVSALASTAWRVAGAAAPDAPAALLTAAASAAGLRIGPPRASAGLLARTERLVRSGGPTYIKLGQFIASAEGLLPREWVAAFGWCRDEAPPLPAEVVADLVASELGPDAPLTLDPEPLAAGSIGQVHRATLDDGTPVVVKARRPGLRRRLRSDIGALALGAGIAERLRAEARAANLSGFIALFAQLVLEELDFRLEALNLVESLAVFEHRGLDAARVPRPIPGLVTERVLVMEAVAGVPYDRALATHGEAVDGEELLRVAITGVLTTTMLHGLFHGDLHAGNVLVDADGTFGLVDFGICGRLDDEQRLALVRYLLGFAASDAQAQIDAMRSFGAIPPGADTARLARELSAELERLDARTDGAITFERLGDTLARLIAVLVRNGFRMPKELVLFFKNLLYLSGFAASVAPDADLFAVVEDALREIGSEHASLLS
jgi:ubiquinone biosynthesis protein